MIEKENLTEKGEEMLEKGNALDDLAQELREAESIANDVPVLSELFNKVRTSSRKGRDGRYVALLDYDNDSGTWSCRSVSFLQSGTHYRDTGADEVTSFNPFPFISVDRFAEHMAANLERDAQATRQNAWNYREEPKRFTPVV